MSYRGGTIPKNLPKQMRKLLTDLDELAVRDQQQAKPATNAAASTTPSNLKTAVQPSLTYAEDQSSGTITSIPIAPAGTLRGARYSNSPTFISGGNLRLAGPPFTPDPNAAVEWLSDGSSWLEATRGPGAETFVPARRYGAVPDTAADMTSRVQRALDNCPNGCILVFEPGTYIVNGVNVTRNNMSIFLPPGCILKANIAIAGMSGVIHVKGTIDTVNTKDVVVSPAANYPFGGDRTIYVAAGDEAFFPINSWLTIEDLEPQPAGLSADPTYELEHHMEICRVKATSAGRIDLWAPLVNSYTSYLPGPVPPKLRQISPVENFHIWGGGTIQDEVDGAGIAATHGMRLWNVTNALIEDIIFEKCYFSALAFVRVQEAKIIKCTFRDAARFDGTGGHGYGISMYGGIRISIVDNYFKRLRHCTDVSFFSRLVTITGNNMVGSTTGNVHTHPCVEGVSIVGNTIDGAFGQDTNTPPSLEYGDAGAQASGINIDEKNKTISIINNTIRNCRLSGIYVDTGSPGFPTEFIDIIGNTIENCLTIRRVSPGSNDTHGGISVIENSLGGTDRNGIVIKGNILREPGPYGIRVGMSNAIVEGNWLYKVEDKVAVPVVGIGIWIAPPSIGATLHDIIGVNVKNNICINCKQNGIRVGLNLAAKSTTSTVVEGNQISGSGSAGIFLEETAPNTIVRNNVSTGNTVDGINTQSSSGWITDNRSYSNTGYGVRILGGADNNLIKDNLFSGNSIAPILDLGASNFIVYLDDANDRVGIGTATPARKFDLFGANICGSTPQFRLSGGASSALVDIGLFDDCSYGGAALQIQPSGGSSPGLQWIHLFGTNDANALSFLDDGGSYWIGRQKAGYDTFFGVASGQKMHFAIAFDDKLVIQPSGVDFTIPGTYRINDANNATTSQIVGIYKSTTGAAAAGIGSELAFQTENSSGSTTATGSIFNMLNVVTAGSEDSSTFFTVKDAGTTKEVFRIEGATPRLMLYSTTTIGGAAPAAQITFDCATGASVFNEQGNQADFRVESDTQANMLLVKGVDNTVYIGMASIGGGAPLIVGGQSGVAAYFDGDIGDLTSVAHYVGSDTTGVFRGFTGLQYDIRGRLLVPLQHNAANVTVNDTYAGETYLSMDTGSARSVTLPPAATKNGRVIWVVDEDRNAAVRNITIIPNGADTIDGVAGNLVLNTNGAAVMLVSYATGNDWQLASRS